jgi:DNA polymerase/3'-5' exonuclease PolX
MNEKIIKEFTKLLDFTKSSQDINARFRIKSFQTIISMLKKYPHTLTLANLIEFGKLSNVGNRTIERITEILTNGYLEEVKDYKKQENELEQVIGIGPAKLKELYRLNILTIKQYIEYSKKNGRVIPPTIVMGIKYYKKCKKNIPRDEITNILKMLKHQILLPYFFTICGSYRRGAQTSNDIDILISSKMNISLDSVIDILFNPLPHNNNQPFLLDSLVHNNKKKYMGFCKYLDNPIRRIDIRLIPYESYYSGLLYFTGSAELNKIMRQEAKKQGYKLSEYGLFKNNKMIKISSEKDIFKILNIPYIVPTKR